MPLDDWERVVIDELRKKVREYHAGMQRVQEELEQAKKFLALAQEELAKHRALALVPQPEEGMTEQQIEILRHSFAGYFVPEKKPVDGNV